jgi:ABC-type multidrug transport system fused ATPase/permease subunit
MAVGMGAIFCKAAKAITSGLSIMSFITKLGATLAFSQFVKVLLEFLLQIKLVAPLWLKIIVALLIAVLIFVEKLLQALNEMIQDRAAVKAVSDEINKLCDTAKRLSGQTVDKTCDVISSDACYWAERTAEELANKMQNDVVEATGTSLIEQAIQIIQDRLHDDSTASWIN